MSALTADQLELLQRACDGVPLWGGSMATERLRRELDLLFALRLIEPHAAGPYQPTAFGMQTLVQTHHEPEDTHDKRCRDR